MTARKRATHFALMDSAFAADRKFIRLAQKAPTPTEYAASVGVFWLLLADARRSKSPELDWAEYDEYQPQIHLLQEVGLLIDTGFPPDPFDKWAPVYKSPSDAARGGTQGNEEVRNGTQVDEASVQFSSPQVKSPQFSEEGVQGENDTLPLEDDPVTLACRYLPNGGEWLGKKDYRVAWEDLVRRFGDVWVKAAIPKGYQECLNRGQVRGWDLKRFTEWVLAEQARSEELAARKAEQERVEREKRAHLRLVKESTPEEQEKARYQQAAIRLGIKLGCKVPTEPTEVRSFVEQHGGLGAA